ncbi:zinc finger protein 84-like [Platysternon megacephalum]|uniref:Zinc finger protein 84-like n=1 Tax=Platysternon megacephalum TaxID=55544 RepID=A0A4D9EJQ4_9SAUR|nr:zinc finger protein 84-like [Platysternon megacephalum]
MDKNAYAMAKFGLESRDNLIPKRDCGFYMKYIFLFTSVIQFLIILGLVLFMIYGNAHAGTDTHLRHLEEQVQELYSKMTLLNAKNKNLTQQLNATSKEKLGCSQQMTATQKLLEKCNASLQAYTAYQAQCQNILTYAEYNKVMAEKCYRNMNILNITCYAEKLSLREARDRLAREAQQQRENCSQVTEKLKQEVGTASSERELCRQDTISLRAQYSGQSQGQNQCCSLGQKMLGEFQNIHQTIQEKVKTLPPYLLNSCTTLTGEVNSQLKALGDKVQQEVQAQAQENGRLHGGKLLSEANLQECRQQRNRETQQQQHQLQALQVSCDAEAKRSYQEKQTLTEEKGRLSQQLQEKNKLLAQAEDTKAQLESCRKAKGSAFPGNPGLRNPSNPGTFGNSGTFRNPGTFGNPGTYGNPGTFGNPGTLGNPGTFGNTDRASLDEIRKRILEEAKLPNQFPPKPVAQPSS